MISVFFFLLFVRRDFVSFLLLSSFEFNKIFCILVTKNLRDWIDQPVECVRYQNPSTKTIYAPYHPSAPRCLTLSLNHMVLDSSHGVVHSSYLFFRASFCCVCVAQSTHSLNCVLMYTNIFCCLVIPQMEAAIQPMMGVIEQVCELIDTTDSVFSFKVRCACMADSRGLALIFRVVVFETVFGLRNFKENVEQIPRLRPRGIGDEACPLALWSSRSESPSRV